MYWYYGQQDMKAAAFAKDEANLFVAYVSNFSCAPDSFILHYLKWTMGQKPFLVLELDSHSADAGIDTRVEAFLDIVDGYRSKLGELKGERYDNGLRFVNDGRSPLHVLDGRSGRRHELFGNPKVKLLLSNMGELSTELMAAVLRGSGVAAEAMPVADERTIQVARAHASGKECVPSHLVLGSALQYFASDKYRKDEIYLLFVPITTGPCRTGQYFVFYENLFRDLRLENVVVVTLSADNSYGEFGPRFSRDVWFSLAIGDYMKDLQNSLRACAEDRKAARAWFDSSWRELIALAETDIRRVFPALRRIASGAAALPSRSGSRTRRASSSWARSTCGATTSPWTSSWSSSVRGESSPRSPGSASGSTTWTSCGSTTSGSGSASCRASRGPSPSSRGSSSASGPRRPGSIGSSGACARPSRLPA